MKQERNPTNVEFKADMDREHGQGQARTNHSVASFI